MGNSVHSITEDWNLRACAIHNCSHVFAVVCENRLQMVCKPCLTGTNWRLVNKRKRALERFKEGLRNDDARGLSKRVC